MLGLYLGDGCISEGRRGSFVLRIACCDEWPGLMEECARAVRAVRPENRVFRVAHGGCTFVSSSSRHWPCYFPQHGPGRKHARPILLEPWQQGIVDGHPWQLIRGLVHSDGSRVVNWTTRVVGKEPKRYDYPRYFFTNKSPDITRLFCDTLDKVGVEWRTTVRRAKGTRNVSVARRDSVRLMDEHVGPKY
ncbi:hypothetical protein GCM10027168_46880 [Streptomyces capparidis]